MPLILTSSKLSLEAKIRIIAGCVCLAFIVFILVFGEQVSQKTLLMLSFIATLLGFISSIYEARSKYHAADTVEKKRWKRSLIRTIIFSMTILSLIMVNLINDQISLPVKANIFLGIFIVIWCYLAYNLFDEYKYSRPKAKELKIQAKIEAKKKVERSHEELVKNRNK